MVVRRFKKNKMGLLVSFLAAVGLGCMGEFSPVWAEDVRWEDREFKARYFEADLSAVLEDIVKFNGLNATVLPEVTGKVTYDFTGNPLPVQGAFNKLMTRHNLTYTYDPASKTVTIMPAVASGSVVYAPAFADWGTIEEALNRFKRAEDETFKDVKILFEPKSNVMVLYGKPASVAQVRQIVVAVDQSMENRHKRSLMDLKEKEESLKRRREEYAAKTEEITLRSHQDVTFKVIPLRYTSVAPSSTMFLGEKVTMPGILDSLRAFIGPITVVDTSKDETNKETGSQAPSEDKPTVSVDVRTNSIIVRGRLEQIKMVEDIVKKLDTEVPLVEIEVMVVNGASDTSRSFGVQLGMTGTFGSNVSSLEPLRAGGFPSSLTLNATTTPTFTTITSPLTGAVTQVPNPVTPGTPEQVGAGQILSSPGGLGAQFIYRGTRQFLESTLSAMANDGKAHTVASPRVVTLNNLPAHISNTDKLTNLSNSTVTIGGTQQQAATQSSTEAGTTLVITPSRIIAEDGSRLVRLTIDAKNSELLPNVGGFVHTAGQGVQTNVIVPDGSTFVMGGLFKTGRREGHSGIPILKDLPVVGSLFGMKSSDDNKTETVFFITPKIYSYKEIATTQGVRAKDYVEDRRAFLNHDQESLETESQLLSMPHSKASDDE